MSRTLRFHSVNIRMEGFATESDGDYFDGEVTFDLVDGDDVMRGLSARVKQAAGSSFAQPLEVLPPSDWSGALDYDRFRDCVERYVRESVSAQIGDHRMAGGDTRVRDVQLLVERTSSLQMDAD